MATASFNDSIALVNKAVLRDPKTDVIKAIKFPGSFRDSLELLCNQLPKLGAPAVVTANLARANLVFLDDFDFHRISELSGVEEALNTGLVAIDTELAVHMAGAQGFVDFAHAVLELIKKRQAVALKAKEKAERAERRKAKEEEAARLAQLDEDVDMTSASLPSFKKRKSNDVSLSDSLPLLIDLLRDLSIDFSIPKATHEDPLPPDAKRLKFSAPTYRPGTVGANQLLKLVDNVIGERSRFPKIKLQEFLNVLEYTAIQQMFALDISQQICRALLTRHKGISQRLQSAGEGTYVSLEGLSFADPFNASLQNASNATVCVDEDAVMAEKKDSVEEALLKLV
ncbi:hypothetical protein H0H93_016086 [Arthromyces matolae]|nr:hypothetical protein H0H93_016086 [Arthromyces matolae]